MSRRSPIERGHRRLASLVSVAVVFAAASLAHVPGALALAPPPISLDQLFGSYGVAAVGESIPAYREAAAVAVTSDGGILVAGENGYARGGAVVRFRRDGLLDRSFGGGSGYVEVPGASGINSLAVDGAGGSALLSQRTTVTRITANGAIDTSFGQGGSVALPQLGPAFASLHFWSLTTLPDGGLLAAGIRFGSPRMVVVRLLPNGSLDPAFGDGGLAIVGFGRNPNSGALAMAVQSNDDIILGGYAHGVPAVARLLPDGSRDPSFGHRGVSAPRGLVGEATALALEPDGSILLVGTGRRRGSKDSENLLLRFRLDGTLDRRFGTAAGPTPVHGDYATPTTVLPTGNHIFVVTKGHGPSIRVYRPNGTEGGWLAHVSGVPRDRFSGTAGALEDGKLIFAWTPKHQPNRGTIRVERFRVR